MNRKHPEGRKVWDQRYAKKHRDRLADKLRRRKAWFTANLEILKRAQGCSTCGRKDGFLDHHHVDPATKRRHLSKMYTYSLESVIDEIAKCVVLCRSCHMRLEIAKRPRDEMGRVG